MAELRERDAMLCRGCGNEERASEGYPCASCGTFICLMCVFRGVVRCSACDRESNRFIPSSDLFADLAQGLEWPDP